MQYENYDEFEDAVADRYDQKILELEKRIDELKHEVNVAEMEADQWEREYDQIEGLRKWLNDNHPDILTTFNVLQRLEDSHAI
jgi:predicted RNase H-like nuclease (RuvC/YqgF family)